MQTLCPVATPDSKFQIPLEKMRVDKFLWSVRLFKTRADAADACRAGRVLVGEIALKASRELKVGEVVSIRKMPALFSYRIIELVGNRQPAKNVHLYIEDVTPSAEREKLEMMAMQSDGKRERGAGRPNKHERRELDEWLGV